MSRAHVTRGAVQRALAAFAPDGVIEAPPERAKPRDLEGPTHRSILKWLRAVVPKQAFVFHVPNGGARNAATGAKLKALGTVAGIPDLCIIMLGRVYFLEVKSERGKPSTEQDGVFGQLERAGAYVAVVRSIEDARDALRKWGVQTSEARPWLAPNANGSPTHAAPHRHRRAARRGRLPRCGRARRRPLWRRTGRGRGKGPAMRVLVACEYSGTVRRAFSARGHDAWSCDLLPAEDGSNRHIIGDARALLNDGWDLLMVAHPPCTRLCNSGVRWLSAPPPGKTLDEMRQGLIEGAALFSAFWNAPVDRIAVENPVMHKHAKALIEGYREPAQSIQPWQFGHGETKRTCLWLKNLPPLVPTNVVAGREQRVHRMSPGPNRWRERSRFYAGIASAMADQWGGDADRVAA